MIEENRSLIKYILLSLITCGIYPFFWLYQFAKDMNTVCYGDNEHTTELGYYILYSFITCGIYSFYWVYKLAQRQKNNGDRYGVYIKDDASTVLLWLIFGNLLFGIGGFVAWYIIINNMNILAHAYNTQGNKSANTNAMPVSSTSNSSPIVSSQPAAYAPVSQPILAENTSKAENITLCCRNGEFAGCEFPIEMNETVVMGRSLSCNIKFADNTPNVSRIHCQITYDGKIWLTDRGSTFGTMLSNGTRLVPDFKTELERGTEFYLGSRNVSFYIK